MIHLKTHNKAIDRYIESLEQDLEDKDISFTVSLRPYVLLSENDKCNGYFDDEGFELAINVGRPVKRWFPVLVHESSHFDQWKEQCKAWKAYIKLNCSDDELTKVINGESTLSKADMKKYFDITRDLELDCERRTLAKIKEFELPIDAREYAKGASAYVFFYNFIAKHKKWYKIGKEPYNTKEIVDLMPDNLDGDYSKLSRKLEKLFKQCV